jgi:hypothetical protein
MSGDAYAQSELREELWENRLTRVNRKTRDLIAATRKIIDQSRAFMSAIDDRLALRP